MQILNEIAFYGPLAILLTILGGVFPLMRHWKEDHLHGLVSLSAGILLATAFLYLMPDALERLEPHRAGLWILASFVSLFILEKFIMLHPCEESHCDYHTVGVTAYAGMLIHTFFDGVALGSAFFVKDLGGMIFVAIMAHKIPSSFSLACILKKAGWSTGRILLFLALFGSMLPLGALASAAVIGHLGTDAIGYALALSLGTFLYISTSDFLPEVHRKNEGRFFNLGLFLMGVVLIYALTRIFPHGHN